MASKGKLGPAKQFGARYGRTIKHIWGKITKQQRAKQQCPYCNKTTVKRVAAGIWECKHCHVKFTSRAYEVKPIQQQNVVEEEVA